MPLPSPALRPQNHGFEFARGVCVGAGMGGWYAVCEVWVDGGMGLFKEWVDR